MKKNKIIAIVLAVVIVLIAAASVFVLRGKNGNKNVGEAGWYIEAESGTLSDNAKVLADENAIGDAVELVEESDKASDLTFDFTVPEEKDYYLHARVSNTGSDSIYFAFNSEKPESVSLTSDADVYTWVRISEGKNLSEGNHSVSLSGSAGLRIDGIMISEQSKLSVSDTVSSSKKAYREEPELLDEYPDIFNEDMVYDDIAFEPGDRVMFLGDSITHHDGYHKWIFTYYATRYPDCEYTYINAGRGGDTAEHAMGRLVYDIKCNNFNKLVVMLGTNDVTRPKWVLRRDNAEECDKVIDSYIENFNTLLGEFPDMEIIIMGPTCWNQYTKLDETLIDSYGYNDELRRANVRLKAYADEKSIPYIDLNTSLTKTMLYYTRENPNFTGLFGFDDRTHPNELGYYLMGLTFLKAQGEGGYVANTVIDAKASAANAENADVSNLKTSETSVSYTYKPNSLPIPAELNYRQLQQIVAIEDVFNREEIKVTGLAEGNYTVKLNGKTALENIPSTDLEAGINIATLSANPNQQKSLEVMGLIDARGAIEQDLRDFKNKEYRTIINPSYGLSTTMTNEELLVAAAENKMLSSYVKEKKTLYNSYGAIDYYEKLIYTVNKPETVEILIERIGDLDNSTSTIHKYTTKEVALDKDSPEIVFETKK